MNHMADDDASSMLQRWERAPCLAGLPLGETMVERSLIGKRVNEENEFVSVAAIRVACISARVAGPLMGRG